jgi:hypothetical protein
LIIPLHSTCDDEDPAGEIQLGLEDLLERYYTATIKATIKATINATINATIANTSSANARAKGNKKADPLQNVSVGILSEAQRQDMRGGRGKGLTQLCHQCPFTMTWIVANEAIEAMQRSEFERKSLPRRPSIFK